FVAVPPSTEISTLSLHDALPICFARDGRSPALEFSPGRDAVIVRVSRTIRIQIAEVGLLPGIRQPVIVGIHLEAGGQIHRPVHRSEEHTSELQSRENLVCRLLLE